MRDPAEDNYAYGVEGVRGDSDLDLISADVATDSRQLTAVIRTDTLRDQEPYAPGKSYDFYFRIAEVTFLVKATTGMGSESYILYAQNRAVGADDPYSGFFDQLGEVTGVFDVAKREIRATVPLDLMARYYEVRRGVVVSEFFVISFIHYGEGRTTLLDGFSGPSGASSRQDEARSDATYKAGTPSCVKVGK